MPIEPSRLQECLAVLEEARSLSADHPDLLQLEQASAHLRIALANFARPKFQESSPTKRGLRPNR